MLAIRLQRLGKSGYPVYRVIVQDAAKHPMSGRIVAQVGSLNPHSKEVKLDKEVIEKYLKNGAQPSPRVAKLLADNGIKLPDWVAKMTEKTSKVRKPEKWRKLQPKEAPVAESTEAPAEEAKSEEVKSEGVKTEATEKESAEEAA